MVDGITLAIDITEVSLYFAAPALLWLFVFLLAYRDVDLASSSGFDRETFWFLIPLALLGSIANLLIFGFGSGLLSVNLGGGILPILLSLWLLGRTLPDPRRALASLLAAAVAGTGGALALVELGVHDPWATLFEIGAVGAPALLLAGLAVRGSSEDRWSLGWSAVVAGLFGATVVATSFTTATIPGLGIVSAFPAYLIAPALLGAVAAVLIRDRLSGSYGPALALPYAGVTLGVLVGADVLHQPPLYAPGAPSVLYSIGGAGLLDLLSLSGLLALAGAYGVVRLLQWGDLGDRKALGVPISAYRSVRRAWYLGLEGRFRDAVREADRATMIALGTLRGLAGLPPPVPGHAWDGIPVPLWVPLDQANLDSIAAAPEIGARDAYRSWMTARALVGVAHVRATRFRAGFLDRALGFGIDLGLIALAMAAVDVVVVLPQGGASDAILNGLPLNAAIVGAVGWGLIYFVLFEQFTGTTPGKRFYGLAVRHRFGGPVDLRANWIRNVPRIVPLTIVAYGIAIGLTVGTHAPGSEVAAVGIDGTAVYGIALLVAAGLALSALLSFLSVLLTEESQRLGDLVAGTVVLREPIRRWKVPAAAADPAEGSSRPVGA